MEKEEEWIKRKKLEEIDTEQEQCRDLQRQLERMEKELEREKDEVSEELRKDEKQDVNYNFD